MRLFGSEPIGSTISVEKYAKFNSLRNTIITRNPEYHDYLFKKCWSIRTFIDLFLAFTPEMLALIDKLMEVEKNERRRKGYS